jgi:BirA family transcriptional regulator, biotin operon repressor / biotin---[acetyl-CoA-carboxylase] ligase
MRITYYQFTSVDSTNSFAKKHMSDFAKDDFTVISAVEQTQGRGRLANKWFSPPGKNLYVTFAFFTTNDIAPFYYSQLAALSLQEALSKLAIQSQIKWPNDILVKGKKIAGILTEVQNADEKLFVALGIGLNVNMTEVELENIPKKATSILVETTHNQKIDELKEQIAKSFLQKLENSEKSKVALFQNEWKDQVSWMIAKKTAAKIGSEIIEGVISRIDNDGALVLLLDNREERTISSAELIS